MSRWVLLLGCAVLMVAVLACSDSIAPGSDEPTLEELLSAPTEIELAGRQLSVESHFILDRMPQAPPPTVGFQGEARVWEKSQEALPTGLQTTRIWVIRGDEIWLGVSPEVIEPEAPYELRRQVISDRGWGNVKVDVVVELAMGEDAYLLRAADQWIQTVI